MSNQKESEIVKDRERDRKKDRKKRRQEKKKKKEKKERPEIDMVATNVTAATVK